MLNYQISEHYTKYISIVHLLYFYPPSIVIPSSINCISTLHLLYFFRPSIVFPLSINCISTVHQLYFQCTSIVFTSSINRISNVHLCISIVHQLYFHRLPLLHFPFPPETLKYWNHKHGHDLDYHSSKCRDCHRHHNVSPFSGR